MRDRSLHGAATRDLRNYLYGAFKPGFQFERLNIMSEDLPKPSILVIIPPPAWALIFILIAAAVGALPPFAAPFRQSFLGAVLFAVGFAISASGRLSFAKAKTEVFPASAKNSSLVTTGLFRRTRNPMYLGILTAMTGIAFMIGSLPAFVAVVAFFFFVNSISIPYEEAKMERQFGEAYRKYKKQVRRWI